MRGTYASAHVELLLLMACAEPTKHQNSKAAREQRLEECSMVAASPISLAFHTSSRNSRYIYMYLIAMINVFLQMCI